MEPNYFDQPNGLPTRGGLQEMREPAHTAFADREPGEQIELLRREILQLRATNRHLDNCLGGIFQQLQNLRQHEHVNGKVMVPADGGYPLGAVSIQAGSSYDPLA